MILGERVGKGPGSPEDVGQKAIGLSCRMEGDQNASGERRRQLPDDSLQRRQRGGRATDHDHIMLRQRLRRGDVLTQRLWQVWRTAVS